MFTPGRYVVVDDNSDELQQLVAALQAIGVPCLGVHYDQEHGVDPSRLSGARILFLDLHLTLGSQAAGVAVSAGVIVQILEEAILGNDGPYVVVLWTRHAAELEGFDQYLRANLAPAKCPLAILSLDKNNYIADGTGPQLQTDLEDLLARDPRLRVLLQWEREVLRAASATMGAVAALVPAADRTALRFSDALDDVLSVLAREALGEGPALLDPRSALNAVLVPILADRLANGDPQADTAEIWRRGVSRIDTAPARSAAEAASLNAMLHVAAYGTEYMNSEGWGVITLIPEDTGARDAMVREMFGVAASDLLANLFKIEPRAARRASRLGLLRLGASCDFAQSRVGPLPYVLCAIFPADAQRVELPLADFETPVLSIAGFDVPVRMAFNTRMLATRTLAQMQGWEPLLRLREQLLAQVVAHAAGYATRPAIVGFPA